MRMRTLLRRTRWRLIAGLTVAGTLAATTLTAAGAFGATAASAAPAAPAASGPACQVSYSTPSDWGSGFTAAITITNNGPAITSWTLAYSYAGNQTLASGWSGNWTQSGKNVTVTNASWNGSLATGASTQIGANFNYSGTNTAPTSFSINGTACT
jgi:cellulase/cellobiase CelA1